jgi:hypothetical protein
VWPGAKVFGGSFGGWERALRNEKNRENRVKFDNLVDVERGH